MKRFMAFLLDLILLIILATGFMWALSAITGYDGYSNSLSSQIEEIENSYGIPAITEEYKVTAEDYSMMTQEERNKFPEEIRTTIESCIKDINSNPDISKTYMMIISITILMVSLSLFFSILILEFIIPLWLKNGQTIGKKIFAIGVMRIDGVKVTPVILFVRSILGKYTVETMIPVLILLMMSFGVGSIITFGVVVLIALFEIILIIATKTHSLIHDILSSSVTVDLPSQMIFDSVEAKQEYQLRIHSEDAKNANY